MKVPISLKLRFALAMMAFAMLSVVAFPGCSQTEPCSGGETYWKCQVVYMDKCPIAPEMADATIFSGTCASNAASAQSAVEGMLLLSKRMVISVSKCVNTYSKYPPMAVAPIAVIKVQTLPPSCDASDTDDPCLACAKLSCCGAFQACSADTNCSCLVGCLGTGGTVPGCISTDGCGPASSVATTVATCLALACPSQCENAGGMASGMCPPMTTSSSSGSSGGPTCTPGSFASGDSCFSDGDCASCTCDPQTMTCS